MQKVKASVPKTAFMILATVFFSSHSMSQTITVVSMIQQMGSRPTIASYPGPGFVGGQADSKDPRTRTRYFYADNDGGNFLRDQTTNGKNEHVMLDVSGPGAITRLVVLGPSFAGHTIRYYLDGSTTPAIQEDLNTLMTGGSFVQSPLVFAAGPQTLPYTNSPPGLNLYLPVPFARHAVVTYDGPENASPTNEPSPILDFIFEYELFPSTANVTTFTQSQYTSNLTTINAALAKLSAVLPVSPNTTPGVSTTVNGWDDANAVSYISQTLAPGQSASATLPSGPHAINYLKANVGATTAAVSGIEMTFTFDGEQTIDTRVGPFFGSGMTFNTGTTQTQSVSSNGALVSVYTMPYQSSASVTMTNRTTSSITVSLKADIGSWTWTSNSMHFHAYERLAGPMLTSNNQVARFLDVQGTGVYVGDNETSTSAQDPADTCYNWWGEGDEMVYVDGAVYPNYRGTGTEDYFGYAYGHPFLFQSPWVSQIASAPQTGQSQQEFTYDGTTVLNRSRLLDTIPFSNRLRFDFEIDDHDQGGSTCQGGTPGPRPSGLQIDHTAFFYALPGAQIVPDSPVSGSVYTIQSKIAGWNLTTNDAGQITEDVFADDGTQRFVITNLSGSVYTLQNAGTGLYVGAAGAGAGTPLTLAPYSGACSQQWTIAPVITTSTPLNNGVNGYNDYFSLVNGCSGGLAMDVVNGSTASQAVVQQYTPNASDSQSWRFDLSLTAAAPVVANGTYNLVNASNGLVLDVPNASTQAGQDLQQYTSNGSAGQSWVINSLGGGIFSVRSAHGGLALDDGASSNDDSPVPQNPWSNSPGERWRLLPFGGSGGIAFVNTDNNEQFQLGVGYNSTASGGPIQQQSMGEGTERIWNLMPVASGTTVPNGLYAIANNISGQTLDVDNAGITNGTLVQQYGFDGSQAQQWTTKQLENGSYSIVNVNSGLALDNGGSITPGASPDQYTFSNGSNQWWQFNAFAGGGYTISNVANEFAVGPPSTVNGGTVACSGNALQQQILFSLTAPVPSSECQGWNLRQVGPTPPSIASPAIPSGTVTTGLPQQTAVPVYCGVENQTCTFDGPALVSYGVPYGTSGANNTFYSQTAVNSLKCSYKIFGGDPDPNVNKNCWYTLLPTAVPDGVYIISNQASHLPLDVVDGSQQNGGVLQQYSDDSSAFQHWRITNQGFGLFSLVNMGSGRALDSYGAGGEGQQLHQYLWIDTPSQLWELQPNIDGSYTFVNNATPGYTMQVQNGSTTPGAEVMQLNSAAGSAQNWNLQPLNSPPVPSGVYALVNRNSHLALDVLNGSKTPGTILQQYTPSEMANQEWAIAQLPNGKYSIRNINTGLVLDDGGVTSSNPGGPADENTQGYPYPSSQQWSFTRNTDGSFALTNAADSLLLGVSNASTQPGAPTSLYTNTGAVDQGWLLQEGPVRLPTGTYTIKNAFTGLLMDVTDGGTGNSALIQQYTPDGTGAQQWSVLYLANSDNEYVLTNLNSGKALDNADATLPGTQADQYAYFNSDNMHWQIYSNNDGTFTVRNVANQFALNIAADSTSAGAAVVQETVGASGSQSWIFQAVP